MKKKATRKKREPKRYDQVDVRVIPSHCRSCSSTKRTPYHNLRKLDRPGILSDGTRYERVTWQRTTCADCGQARTDRTYYLSALRNPPLKTIVDTLLESKHGKDSGTDQSGPGDD